MMEVQPLLLSAIICDRVIFDKVSGMPSIIDIVQTINAPKYPSRYGQLVFFCELTDGHGRNNAKIRMVDVEKDERVIFEQDGEVVFQDAKQVVTLIMNLRGIVFPEPGEYRFQIFTNGTLLGERRIICRKIDIPMMEG